VSKIRVQIRNIEDQGGEIKLQAEEIEHQAGEIAVVKDSRDR